jgi:alpha/beta superfamily hydrolase
LYLHGNGGSKLECLGFVPFLCKNNAAIIGFDFVGCGNSDHGYLTYGVNESKDAELVI